MIEMDKVNQSGPATIYGSSVPNNSLPTRPAELNSQYRPDDSHAADWCYAQQKNKPQSNSVVGRKKVFVKNFQEINGLILKSFQRL